MKHYSRPLNHFPLRQWFKHIPKSGRRRYDALAKDAVRPCKMWRGKRDKQGYGRVHLRLPDGKIVERAHRLVFYKTSGILPKGCVVKHACGKVGCVEPSHLILGLPDSTALETVANPKRSEEHTSELQSR